MQQMTFAHPDDLIALSSRFTDGRVTTGLIAAAELTRINQSVPSAVRVAGFGSSPLDVTLLRENAPPVQAGVTFVGEGFFDLFGLPMTLGSAFTHEQHVPTA